MTTAIERAHDLRMRADFHFGQGRVEAAALMRLRAAELEGPAFAPVPVVEVIV